MGTTSDPVALPLDMAGIQYDKETLLAAKVAYESESGAVGTDSFIWEVREVGTEDEFAARGRVIIKIE